MSKMEALLVLAEAVAEDRLTAAQFATVCIPLYKHYPDRYASEAHYQAATDLFYLADDYWLGEGVGPSGTLNEEQVRMAASDIVLRIRSLPD